MVDQLKIEKEVLAAVDKKVASFLKEYRAAKTDEERSLLKASFAQTPIVFKSSMGEISFDFDLDEKMEAAARLVRMSREVTL